MVTITGWGVHLTYTLNMTPNIDCYRAWAAPNPRRLIVHTFLKTLVRWRARSRSSRTATPGILSAICRVTEFQATFSLDNNSNTNRNKNSKNSCHNSNASTRKWLGKGDKELLVAAGHCRPVRRRRNCYVVLVQHLPWKCLDILNS